MSTNDCVFALANGLAGNPRISEPGPDLDVLENALTDLLGEMGRAMAADGEGATKMMEVVVAGAPTDAIARECALALAASPLVKAAVFGADPNWGRILATVGARAGAQGWPVDPFKARVVLQGVTVFATGAPIEADREALRARMRESRIDVLVELAEGSARAVAWGCDLSYDYVKITTPRSSTRRRTVGSRRTIGSPTTPPRSRRRCSRRRSSTSPPSRARSRSSSTAAPRW
jgi:acetylglutamate kinase